jgi:hypothetical protein
MAENSVSKPFYKSKMFWANAVAVVAFAVQQYTGYVVPAEWQLYLLAGVNFLLRWATKQAITW